jgi:5'-3' exonuclease
MTEEVSEELKKEIFELISMPGVEIQDIAEKLNIGYEKVMKILSDEYLKHNLDYGRRMCCRF